MQRSRIVTRSRIVRLLVPGLCVIAVAGAQKHRGRAVVPPGQPGVVVQKHALGAPNVPIRNFDMAPPAWVNFGVDWSLTLNQDDQALYQQMVNLLGGVTAPADRFNYYSAVNNPPDFTITGWGGMVSDVTVVANGYLVTLTVDPYLSTTNWGNSVSVSSDYQEQYLVDANNNVTYAGFLDPEGWAGTSPVMAVD